MKRKIYNELIKWKENTDNIKPLMVLGVRQAGKTYIIDEFCKREYKNYIYVNLLEQTDIIELYNSNLTSLEKFNRLKLLLDFDIEKPDTILFIDEIQESEKLISELKYFCEQHNNIRIVCAGSLLGVKLKRTKFAFPVGKVKMLNLYPMDFEEFLLAFNQDALIEMIRDCYNNNKPMGTSVHTKAMNLYRTYLFTGGMPESVNNMLRANGDYIKYDKSILNDILDSYFKDMNKYVTSDAEALKINRVYASLPSQLANISNKFQYSTIEKGGKARDYDTSIDWLQASNMIIPCKCVKLPEIPLEGFVDSDIFKLYLSDVGILNSILKISFQDILNDNISLYKGVIAENYVANQLVCNLHNLYYYRNANNTKEIDFLIYTDDGIVPLEVKADNHTKSKSLNSYIEKYKPSYAIRVSSKDFGYNATLKIKSVPLYAVFLIK